MVVCVVAEVRLYRTCKLWTWPSREAMAAVGVSGEDRTPGTHAEGVLAQSPRPDAQKRDRVPTCRRKSESVALPKSCARREAGSSQNEDLSCVVGKPGLGHMDLLL